MDIVAGRRRGYVRPVSETALLIIDMLNTYEHDDSEPLRRSVRSALPQIAALVERARAAEIDVVYVNDHHGLWSAGRDELLEHVLDGPHADLVEPIVPPEDAPFLVKARHSAFYATLLEYLLGQLGATRLVLAGQVTEQCILYSALDAYIRHYEVVVPRDAVAHIHEELAQAALRLMQVNMRAEIVDAEACLGTPARP
jgi:nicotinamidase-related amidase